MRASVTVRYRVGQSFDVARNKGPKASSNLVDVACFAEQLGLFRRSRTT